MFLALIYNSSIYNSANPTFDDNYCRLAKQNYSSVSLISKNSQIDENKSTEIEKDYDNEFDWPLHVKITCPTYVEYTDVFRKIVQTSCPRNH